MKPSASLEPAAAIFPPGWSAGASVAIRSIGLDNEDEDRTAGSLDWYERVFKFFGGVVDLALMVVNGGSAGIGLGSRSGGLAS